MGVWEFRAASGQSGIIKQKGPHAAPESWFGGILEVGAAQNKEPGVREISAVGLGVASGYCVGDLGLEFPAALGPVGYNHTAHLCARNSVSWGKEGARMAWALKLPLADEVIESGLVQDFDASLSGIGQELGAGAYSMR